MGLFTEDWSDYNLQEKWVEVEVPEHMIDLVEWIMKDPVHLKLVRLFIENDTLKKRVKELEDLIRS